MLQGRCDQCPVERGGHGVWQRGGGLSGHMSGARANCHLFFSNLHIPPSAFGDFKKQNMLFKPIIYVHFPLHLSLGQNSDLISTHRPVGPITVNDCDRAGARRLVPEATSLCC